MSQQNNQALQEWIADFLREERSGCELIRNYRNLDRSSRIVLLQRLDEIIVIFKTHPQKTQIVKDLKDKCYLQGVMKQLCDKFDGTAEVSVADEAHLLTRLVIISMTLTGLLGTEENELLQLSSTVKKEAHIVNVPGSSALKDHKIYPNLVLFLSREMNELLDNVFRWEHLPRNRECVVFQLVSELMMLLLHFDEFAPVLASSQKTVDEICKILLEGLQLYAENKKAYPVLFHLFCIFARDRHISSEQLLELTEKMRGHLNCKLSTIFSDEHRESFGQNLNYVSQIVFRSGTFGFDRDSEPFLLIFTARCQIYGDEDKPELMTPYLFSYVPKSKVVWSNQIYARTFATLTNNLDSKTDLRWFAPNPDNLIKGLHSCEFDKKTVTYLLSGVTSICRVLKYRSLFFETKGFLEMIVKVFEFYANSDHEIAGQVLSLIWVLLEDPVFHAYLLGSMEAFNLPEVPLDAPNLVRILTAAEKLMQSTSSIGMKQSCLFLFSALTTVPTQAVLDAGNYIGKRSPLGRRFIPEADTTSTEYYPLLLVKVLKCGTQHKTSDVDELVQFATVALWFRCRYNCHSDKILISSPSYPALLLQSMLSRTGNTIQAIAGSISGLCVQNEENRCRFGAIEGFALQLTSYLLHFKDNEAIALSICEAIGTLSLLKENAIAFGKVELLFDLLVEILSLYKKNPMMYKVVAALGSLSACDTNAILISKATNFYKNLDAALEVSYKNTVFVRAWCDFVGRLQYLRSETEEVFAALDHVSYFQINRALESHLADEGILFTICHFFINYSVFVQDAKKTHNTTWVLNRNLVDWLEKETNSGKNIKVIEDLCKVLYEFAQQPDCLWGLTYTANRFEKLRPVLTKLNEHYPENDKITVPCITILTHLNQPSILSLKWYQM
jgi:hypothetical protein